MLAAVCGATLSAAVGTAGDHVHVRVHRRNVNSGATLASNNVDATSAEHDSAQAASDECNDPHTCSTLPDTRWTMAKGHNGHDVAQCSDGCDESAIEHCQSMLGWARTNSLVCHPKVRDEGGDGLPYKCVDLCAEKPCAGEVENTVCYVDHAAQPAVAKCRSHCDGPPTKECRSKGDSWVCRPKTGGAGPSYTCVDLCQQHAAICEKEETNTQCYVDHAAQPRAVAGCRNICTTGIKCRWDLDYYEGSACRPQKTAPFYICLQRSGK